MNLLLGEKRKNEETIPIMVLISDGRANVPVHSGESVDIKNEVLEIAEEARSAGIHVIIIDTESVTGSFIKMQLGYCKEIAQRAGGRYFSIDHLSPGQVHDIVVQEQELVMELHSKPGA